MTDRLSPQARSRNMQAIKASGMKPELIVRRVTHALGYRFRLHRHDLPGRPDLVFPSRHKIIQVYGCFWHQHLNCPRSNVPKSRIEYWLPKLTRNADRDRRTRAALKAQGWKVLVIWECQTRDAAKLKRRIGAFLGEKADGTIK